ncbi:hepatic triacylglycerol lipase [Perognathus longimembris pacificus]|uniref:hepatic triacylglycerol lipase n=1 Tax=Perognathus longimembris pacificus TaxID=214514 RepID=UPI00201947F7|nr:hepatic triacylglycerol lipase [Perognathus longimembris pacificus]
MIVHGWSLDGKIETWMRQMAAALKSGLAEPVNVVLVNWIPLAHQSYPIAVLNTRLAGQDIATLLKWLEETVGLSRSKVHLIGFSLGAHVSGFAGSYIGGKHKIGRITGLDAAGPLFEKKPPQDRLSPDDANFVDAIHTFTKKYVGMRIGFQEPIGHYDFYPNGGTQQPGCHILEMYKHIGLQGLKGILKTLKCSHERAVHLFIDSLKHNDQQMIGYQCTDMERFKQGLCLHCRKGRCNTMGYHIRQDRPSKSRKLFLITQAQSPFKVNHYQFKIKFINEIVKPVEPTLSMSLLGTKGEKQNIRVTLGEHIVSNKTYSFLLTLDLDIGELSMIKFKWETKKVWTQVWNIIRWGPAHYNPGLTLKTIQAKVGDTQQRMTFCSENTSNPQLHPNQEKIFVKCEENLKKMKRKSRT